MTRLRCMRRRLNEVNPRGRVTDVYMSVWECVCVSKSSVRGKCIRTHSTLTNEATNKE